MSGFIKPALIHIKIHGMSTTKSRVYHGRYECFFYGRRGKEIKSWIRNTFGETDDLVYTNDNLDGSSVSDGCGALITEQQLTLTVIRWT